MRAADKAQALAEGKPVDGNKSFGGYCTDCDRPMFKHRYHEDQRASTWTRRSNATYCRRCYRNLIGNDDSPLALLAGIAGLDGDALRTVSRSAALPNCVSCGCPMRAKGTPKVAGVRARHTTDLCTACYQRRRRKGEKDRPKQGDHRACA